MKPKGLGNNDTRSGLPRSIPLNADQFQSIPLNADQNSGIDPNLDQFRSILLNADQCQPMPHQAELIQHLLMFY